jgi:hypothetical protein
MVPDEPLPVMLEPAPLVLPELAPEPAPPLEPPEPAPEPVPVAPPPVLSLAPLSQPAPTVMIPAARRLAKSALRFMIASLRLVRSPGSVR